MHARRRRLMFTVGLLALLCAAAPAHAQDVHWGATVDISPVWVMPDMRLFLDSYPIDYRGSEFRVGVVRGRSRGGHWGVSFVRKHGTNTRREGAIVIGDDAQWSMVSLTRAVTISGIEVHKFTSFMTITRAQIGLEYGAGLASVHHVIRRHDVYSAGTDELQNGEVAARGLLSNDVVVASSVAGSLSRAVAPLLRVEVVAGVPVAPGATVIVKAGLGFPGLGTAAVSFNYFFGK